MRWTSEYPLGSFVVQSVHLPLMPMTFFTQIFSTFTIAIFVSLVSRIEASPHFIPFFVRLVSQRGVVRVLLVSQVLIISILRPMAFRRFGMLLMVLLLMRRFVRCRLGLWWVLALLLLRWVLLRLLFLLSSATTTEDSDYFDQYIYK